MNFESSTNKSGLRFDVHVWSFWAQKSNFQLVPRIEFSDNSSTVFEISSNGVAQNNRPGVSEGKIAKKHRCNRTITRTHIHSEIEII